MASFNNSSLAILFQFSSLFHQKGITDVHCEEFVELWVSAYSKNMQEISEEKCPFTLVDELNKIALNETLQTYQIANQFTEEEIKHMWMIWHR